MNLFHWNAGGLGDSNWFHILHTKVHLVKLPSELIAVKTEDSE